MKVGDHITFDYKQQNLTGVIVQLDDFVTIKLVSGYNILVNKKDMKEVKTQSVIQDKKTSAPLVVSVEGLPSIKIIHTGGTIASKVDYETGAVVSKFTEQDIITMFPEMLSIANISSVMMGNYSSEMLRFAHWNNIAKEVEKAMKEKAQGVIITLGTDGLATIASGVSFILENISIPVLFVGAQRSSDRPSSDAASNLLCATKFIVDTGNDFQGVGICMHEGIDTDNCHILSPLRSRKMHTSRRDAFKPINDTPFATISYPGLKITKNKEYPASSGKFSLKLFDEKIKVGIVYVHQQMFAEEIDMYTSWDGVVLAGTGLGHVPTVETDTLNTENKKIAASLDKLAKKIPVTMAPQTIFGRINMNVYSPGRQLIDMGVLGQDLDMTIDTSFVKLAWLLSHHKKEVAKLYSKNLRGELSTRSDDKGYLD